MAEGWRDGRWGHSGGEYCSGGGDRYDGGVLSPWGVAVVAGRRGRSGERGRGATAARDHGGGNEGAEARMAGLQWQHCYSSGDGRSRKRVVAEGIEGENWGSKDRDGEGGVRGGWSLGAMTRG